MANNVNSTIRVKVSIAIDYILIEDENGKVTYKDEDFKH